MQYFELALRRTLDVSWVRGAQRPSALVTQINHYEILEHPPLRVHSIVQYSIFKILKWVKFSVTYYVTAVDIFVQYYCTEFGWVDSQRSDCSTKTWQPQRKMENFAYIQRVYFSFVGPVCMCSISHWGHVV